MTKRSPQALAAEALRNDGWHVETVEQWVPMAKGGFRRDLLGFIDLLCWKGPEVMGVQVTSAPNINARIKKIADSDRVHHARAAGWALWVWGLHKDGTWRKVDVS